MLIIMQTLKNLGNMSMQKAVKTFDLLNKRLKSVDKKRQFGVIGEERGLIFGGMGRGQGLKKMKKRRHNIPLFSETEHEHTIS